MKLKKIFLVLVMVITLFIGISGVKGLILDSFPDKIQAYKVENVHYSNGDYNFYLKKGIIGGYQNDRAVFCVSGANVSAPEKNKNKVAPIYKKVDDGTISINDSKVTGFTYSFYIGLGEIIKRYSEDWCPESKIYKTNGDLVKTCLNKKYFSTQIAIDRFIKDNGGENICYAESAKQSIATSYSRGTDAKSDYEKINNNNMTLTLKNESNSYSNSDGKYVLKAEYSLSLAKSVNRTGEVTGCTVSGASCSIKGNKITIKSSKPITNTTVTITKQYTFYKAKIYENDNYQWITPNALKEVCVKKTASKTISAEMVSLTLQKRDEKNKELPGAKFKVCVNSTTNCQYVDMSNTPNTSISLTKGLTYKVTETQFPSGYIKISSVSGGNAINISSDSFTVKMDSRKTVTITNAPPGCEDLLKEIVKEDSTAKYNTTRQRLINLYYDELRSGNDYTKLLNFGTDDISCLYGYPEVIKMEKTRCSQSKNSEFKIEATAYGYSNFGNFNLYYGSSSLQHWQTNYPGINDVYTSVGSCYISELNFSSDILGKNNNTISGQAIWKSTASTLITGKMKVNCYAFYPLIYISGPGSGEYIQQTDGVKTVNLIYSDNDLYKSYFKNIFDNYIKSIASGFSFKVDHDTVDKQNNKSYDLYLNYEIKDAEIGTTKGTDAVGRMLWYSAEVNYEASYPEKLKYKKGTGVVTNSSNNDFVQDTYGFVTRLNNPSKTGNTKITLEIKDDDIKKYLNDTKSISTDCKYNLTSELVGCLTKDCSDDDYKKLNLEFRSIDTSSWAKAFPGINGTGKKARKTGSNWVKKEHKSIITENNNSYNRTGEQPLISITLTPTTINEIRKYNKTKNYFDYDLTCENGENCKSAFVNELLNGRNKYGLLNDSSCLGGENRIYCHTK